MDSISKAACLGRFLLFVCLLGRREQEASVLTQLLRQPPALRSCTVRGRDAMLTDGREKKKTSGWSYSSSFSSGQDVQVRPPSEIYRF